MELEQEQAFVDIEEEMKRDLEVDDRNLLGELRRQKDIMYKWTTRLAKVENELKKTIIEIDVLTRDFHVFYTTKFERTLNSHEVRTYTSAEKRIVELRNKRRKLETVADVIKGGIASVRERGRSISVTIHSMRDSQL
jgi:hypothetical protein